MGAMGEFLNMREFNQLKNNNASKSNIAQELDGPLRLCNKYEGFFTDPESTRRAKTPYFLEISKIREVIYVTEGAGSAMAYKEWRNTLYKAGYTESIVHKEEQRLLTLEELEALGRFFWESVFSESSRGIPIEMATSKVSLNHRISTKLAPETIYPASLQIGSSKRKPENQDVLTTKPTSLTKAERKS